MVHILLCSSAVRVHGLEACRKMDMTRDHIGHILELREVLNLNNNIDLDDINIVTCTCQIMYHCTDQYTCPIISNKVYTWY